MGYSALGILLFLMIALTVVSFSYNKTLVKYLKKYLNEHLLTEIIIDRIDFSMIKKFPYATVEFSNVLIKSRAGLSSSGLALAGRDTLMSASKIYFQFGLLGLLHNEFQLKKIHMTDGKINVFTDPSGRNNYSIWKSTDKEKEGEGYTFDFNNVILSGFDLHYTNLKNPAFVHSFIDKMAFNGSVSGENGRYAVKSELFFYEAGRNGSYRIKNIPVYFDFKASSQKDRLIIRQGGIMLNKLLVELQGNIRLDSTMDADFTLESSNFGLDEIYSFVRPPERSRLNDYALEGKGKIKARIKGQFNTKNSVGINMVFSLYNGSVTNKKTKSKLSHIGIIGSFSGNNPKNYSLVISQFESRLSTGKIYGKATVKNLIRPDFTCELYSSINLNNLNHLLDLDTIEYINGTLNANLKAAGTFAPEETPGLSNILSSIRTGSLELEEGSLKLKGQDFILQDINGKIMIGRDISFQDFALTLNETNFLVTGTFKNAINYFIDNKSIIEGNVYAYSKVIDGVRFISVQQDSTDDPGIHFPERIQIRASLNADEFRFGKFNASELKCDMDYSSNILNINKFNIKFIDGTISGNALISQQGDSCLLVNCASKLNHIDIQQFFIACNNFGQDFIGDENLRGKLDGNVLFTACWDNQLNFLPSGLTAQADVEIFNGELLKFEPMLSLSKYINVEELKNIKFKTLRNTITISDEKIRIPEMLISSSAFEITLSGIHSFDYSFDYRLRVALSDVLFNKAKRKKKEIEDYLVMEDNVDETIIPISIIGNPDDFKVNFDSKKAFYLIREKIQQQGTEMKGPPGESIQEDTKTQMKHPQHIIEWDNDPADESPQKETPIRPSDDEIQIKWEEEDSSDVNFFN
jgi:hypothetical protein